MGIWGHRLFEDDCALDIRGEFRDYIGDGLTPAEATRRMVRDWKPVRWDPEGYASFWLALASTQWDCGRLTRDARRRAIRILDTGMGLDAWAQAGPHHHAARLRVYRQIKQRLLRTPPPARPIARRTRCTTTWKRGDVVAYRCRSGREIYLRVLELSKDRGGAGAVVDICSWARTRHPTRIKAGAARPRRPTRAGWADAERFYVFASERRPIPPSRAKVIARRVKCRSLEGSGVIVFGLWTKLDAYLLEAFGIV